uniref:RRM domain-containing protein n=1 Tax=Chenopodium quinoa TaxID=63459 RepID=A0A803LHU6_CHEQI
MADGVWGRQGPLYTSSGMLKRPRNDYELPPSRITPALDMRDYLIRDDERGGPRVAKDSQTLGSAYDRYLQRTEVPSYNAGEASTFPGASLGRGISVGEPSLLGRPGSMAPDAASNGRDVGFGGQLRVDTLARPRGGDPLILCFVDFVDAACAATALSALQGYKMDEDDRDSAYLRIQFSRHPGPRSGAGSRGRH